MLLITGLCLIVLGCSDMLAYYDGDWGLGDKAVPESVSINSNAQFAYSVEAELEIFSETAVQMRMRNEGDVWTDDEDGWVDYSTSYPWILDYGNGTKTVYLEFRDEVGIVTRVQDDIVFIFHIGHNDALDDRPHLLSQHKLFVHRREPAIRHPPVDSHHQVIQREIGDVGLLHQMICQPGFACTADAANQNHHLLFPLCRKCWNEFY